MNALLDKVSDSHSHNIKGARCNLFVNCENVKSIKYIAPKLWNALDEKLKVLCTVSSFKQRSKEEFLLGYTKFSCNIRGCYSCNLPWPFFPPLRPFVGLCLSVWSGCWWLFLFWRYVAPCSVPLILRPCSFPWFLWGGVSVARVHCAPCCPWSGLRSFPPFLYRLN
jgi:hypothetical protein